MDYSKGLLPEDIAYLFADGVVNGLFEGVVS